MIVNVLVERLPAPGESHLAGQVVRLDLNHWWSYHPEIQALWFELTQLRACRLLDCDPADLIWTAHPQCNP